ncbi:apolipoprotein B-100-like [Phycodurus eques]|uniref:apolipoprotein B-100-like n=1 Tax=Phycodurus eques TaxID=693459 RepID=UPI002ACE9E02|nr:apolipoprotein B-100-like [Phycodurus eques]
MGRSRIYLLLLLGTCTLAQQDVGSVAEQSPTCFLAKRFRNFRRFLYDYEALTFNGVPGANVNKSGPKVSCQVDLEVPQTCSFILRTTECSLSEIFAVDDDGKALYHPAAGAQAFKAAMAKNPLKVTVERHTDVKLFPEEDEPVNILNIKRGILSSLLVPVMEEERNNKMPTVYGVCATDFTVNARGDIATDVTISRDLSRCDSFSAHKQATSPLALISGMHYPLSKLISSHQTCNYKFDNQKKHMTSGTCTERHIFLPLSHKNEYGISTLVKQTVTLRETAKINDRVFDHNEALPRFLPIELVDDKSPVQTQDAAITTMEQLKTLSQTSDGEQRASLFHKLVSELRGLKADVLQAAAIEMIDMSDSLAMQALVQCGTPECTSAMLRVLGTLDKSAVEVEAAVYALALLPNPSRLMVKDMLAMAQNRKSKPIMYALSNVVRRLYRAEGKVTPEITAVSNFMTSLLGPDCSGEKDLTFLTLRVVGNIGDVIEDADPAIKNTLLKCMRQPATTLSVQLAAIQAFRRMSLTDEVRSNLQRVSQYPKGAVQKRLAAYLILMRNPINTDIDMVKKILKQEQNEQVKSFVTSHVYNIISSTDPETQKLGRKIMDGLQDIDVGTHNDYTTKSRNYKLGMAHESMQASIQGNVIFDPSNQLPREVMLESTLKVFGYNMDMWELGIEGKGSEPSIEALFGKNGFFPDTLSKTLYWAENKMPLKMMEVLEKWVAPLKSEGQKVPEDLMREIVRNFNKLVKDLQDQESPEAMAYLKIMGTELGYIKASDLKFIADNAKMYAEIFLKILPAQVVSKLMSGTDNEIFIHYMFMDNKFVLPTASGLPLTFSLSGTFTPGAKGGLRISPNMNELLFMPSVGVEFVTQMGVHVPEFVVSTVEMHTSLYHESALNAKLTMESNQVKLSIPAAQAPAKLLRISNRVMIVGDGKAAIIPHNMGNVNCDSLYGIKYCTKKLQVDVRSKSDVYFPLAGETMFGIDIEPKVSYTATIAYTLLNEGNDGRQKVDSLKITLKTEGGQAAEASATMKYNRNRNVFTSQIQIPDFDVEAGIKVGLTDSSAKGKALTLELSNKNVPQLTLTGRAHIQAMTDGMLQIQLVVPALKTDATISATMSKAEELIFEIKSDMKLPETSSIQSVTFKYGIDQAEVKLMSNMNAETKVLVPYTGALRSWVRQFAEDAMDHRVGNTDMKLRHIVNKAFEASNIWMNKISADVPYVETLKNNIAKVEMPSMPENLFMNMESKFRYQFNKDYLTISIPLPLGGKSSEELFIFPNIITMPLLGVELAPQQMEIPKFTIPSEQEINLPLIGMVEVSAKVNSNYYNWETTVSAGNNTVDTPNYLAKFKVQATSPIKLLSFTTEGATEVTDTAEKTLKFTLNGSLVHEFVSTRVNMEETIAVSDNVTSSGKYNIHAAAPLGLQTSLEITKHFTLDSAKLLGDINADGSVTIGSLTASTTYLNTFSADHAKKEVRLESTLRANSEILKVTNKIKSVYANENLMIESNTNINSDPIKHSTKINLNYKDVKLSILSNSVTKTGQRMLQSQVEFSASEDQTSLRIGNTAEDTVNRAYSLLTGSLNPSGLELNADASINIFSSLASHKATLALNANGLTTSCTTTAQHRPVTFENIFHSGLDANGATMSLTTKGGTKENKVYFNVEGKIANSEAYLNGVFNGDILAINTRNTMNFRISEDGLILSNNIVGSFNEMRTDNSNSLSLTPRSLTLHTKTDSFLNTRNSYMHDITVTMERFTASAMIKNNLKIMEINFNNDAQFKAQPYNMELTGTVRGDLSEDELKHSYEVKFMNMILSTKCNTNGNILGSQITHATDMEVAGLTVKFNNVADYKSQSLRFDSKINAVAEPFSLTVDALLNSNGGVSLYGQQSGELYSKFLLKAEPLLFTHSFEYRASTTHEIKGRPTIKTNVDNKLSSTMSLKEQSVHLTVKSKVNDHTFDQELGAYNNAERMAIDMRGAVTTNLFSETIQDYSMSGFVKYDKNTDSHFIQIPFTEHIPAIIEVVKNTVMRLTDNGIELLKDINTEYEIGTTIQNKVSELKEVIDNFDLSLIAQNVKKYVNSFENVLTNLTAKLPTEKVINVLKSVKGAIMAWIQKYNISNRFNVIYEKMEEILSKYEVDKMIGAVMDEVVKIMKQYQVREKIKSVFALLRSIDIQPLIKKVMVPIEDLVNELYSFDFKQLIEDMRDYVMRMVQKIQSFDYDKLTLELKEKVTDMSKIPCFGKLYGEFKINSPHYKLRTTADLENTTATSVTPEFKLNLNSQATSTLTVLQFTIDANAHLAVPKMSRLAISEYIKIDQSSFKLDHKGTMTIYGLSGQGSAETTAKISTKLYSADLVNNVFFAMEDGLSTSVDTDYNHDLNMPPLNIFTHVSSTQKTNLALEAGSAHLKMNTLANAKYAIRDFSDEATHNSNMDLVMDLHTAKVTFIGATSCIGFKTNQNVVADICIFRHAIVDAKVETETPVMKGSVLDIKFQARVEDMKIDLTASHNAQLIEGTLSSSALALITPTELTLESKNKGNSKLFLPFKLSGKMEFDNDIFLTLNPEVQQASWTGMTRVNQYKYSHYFKMDNGEREINIITQINGEANLDLLRQPITIPEITVPYYGMRTPKVEDFSLWEDAGLGYLLSTTQQTFDMSSKIKYMKNPEMFTININADPVINVINTNIKNLHKKVLMGKDKAADILASTYANAQGKYEKYNIELPKTLTIPAYRVPVINVEMSTFTIPLPDTSLVTMPALHVPSAISKFTLPRITLPKIQSIKIPMMGDLTFEFSMKAPMITLKSNASILNQDSFIIKLDASSSSQFEFLTGQIQGNTNVNMFGGFKMASLLAVKNTMLEGDHGSTIILNCEKFDASISNSVKVNLPCETMEVHQEITGNSLVFSLSTTSAGHVGIQMQTKRPAQVRARLYGRYPTEPQTDIDILALKMSVMNSEKLNIQTSWNMEMPYEMMLGLKKNAPVVVQTVTTPAIMTYDKISRYARSLEGSFQQARNQGTVMLNRAVDNFAAVNPSDMLTSVKVQTNIIVRKYQKKVETFLDAAVKFLRETKFLIPGYAQRLSGLEVYQKCSTFVAEVYDKVIQNVSKFLFFTVKAAVESFEAIEFKIPGSSLIVSGRDILNDSFRALRIVQDQVSATVRHVGGNTIEDILRDLSALNKRLLEILRSQDVAKLPALVTDMYQEAIDSHVFTSVVKQIEKVHHIISEYLKTMTTNLQNILANISTEQLQSDIQYSIDLMLKRANAFHHNIIRILKEKSKTVEPFVRVGDRQMEVDIPFPFLHQFN